MSDNSFKKGSNSKRASIVEDANWRYSDHDSQNDGVVKQGSTKAKLSRLIDSVDHLKTKVVDKEDLDNVRQEIEELRTIVQQTAEASTTKASGKGLAPGMTMEQQAEFKKQVLLVSSLIEKVKELDTRLGEQGSFMTQESERLNTLKEHEEMMGQDLFKTIEDLSIELSEKIARQRVELQKLAGDDPQPINYDPFNYGDPYKGNVIDFEARQRILALKSQLTSLTKGLDTLKISVTPSPMLDLKYKLVRLDDLLRHTGIRDAVQGQGQGQGHGQGQGQGHGQGHRDTKASDASALTNKKGSGGNLQQKAHSKDAGVAAVVSPTSEREAGKATFPRPVMFQEESGVGTEWSITDSIMQTVYRLEMELAQVQRDQRVSRRADQDAAGGANRHSSRHQSKRDTIFTRNQSVRYSVNPAGAPGGPMGRKMTQFTGSEASEIRSQKSDRTMSVAETDPSPFNEEPVSRTIFAQALGKMNASVEHLIKRLQQLERASRGQNQASGGGRSGGHGGGRSAGAAPTGGKPIKGMAAPNVPLIPAMRPSGPSARAAFMYEHNRAFTLLLNNMADGVVRLQSSVPPPRPPKSVRGKDGKWYIGANNGGSRPRPKQADQAPAQQRKKKGKTAKSSGPVPSLQVDSVESLQDITGDNSRRDSADISSAEYD